MTPVVGVISVLWRDDHVLLIKRGQEPQRDHWGFPGGKLEWRESVTACAKRELREETGLSATPVQTLSAVEIFGKPDDAYHFILLPVLMTDPGGQLHPASDAVDAHWFPGHELPAALCEKVADVVAATRLCR